MKNVFKTLIFLTLVLAIAEIILRMLGYQPIVDFSQPSKIQSEPSPMFCENETYGYVYCPGSFEVLLNESLEYQLTTNQLGYRANTALPKQSIASLAIFGCSFFSGMGVNDEEVLDVALSKLMVNVSITNYAVPGYGMPAQLKTLESLIEQGNPPNLAVFEIASFHLVRNPGAYMFIKNFISIKEKPVKYLTATLGGDGQLRFEMLEVDSKVSCLEKKSALAFLIKKAIMQTEYSNEYLLDLENVLIQEAYIQCQNNGIQALFMVITKDEISDGIIEQMQARDIPYFQTTVDHHKDSFNLNPYDLHPNAYAHKIYAEEIFSYIGGLDAN